MTDSWVEEMFDSTVERLRATTTTDTYGNTVMDWSTPDSKTMTARCTPPLARARAGKLPNYEDTSGRDAVASYLELWVTDTDITALDRVIFGDLTYEVMGSPGNRTDMDGNYVFTKLLLSEVSG